MKKIFVVMWFYSLFFMSYTQTLNHSTERQWYSKGPYAVHVNCIDVSKSDPNTIYLGSYGHGVFVSTDKGLSWEPCSTENWPVYTDSVSISINEISWWYGLYPPVTFITIDPVDSKHVYIGLHRQGIRESTDRGKTWKTIAAEIPVQTVYTKLLINEENTNEMFVIGGRFSLNGGLFKSNDSGQTWQVVDSVPHGSEVIITDIARDPSEKNHLLVGIGYNNLSEPFMGLMESHDNGNTWTVLNNIEAIHDICFDPMNSNHLAAIIYNGWGDWILGESSDGGKNWEYKYPDGNIMWSTSLYKDNQGNLYLTRGVELQYVYFSPDFGTTWEPIDTVNCWYPINAAMQIRANETNFYFGNPFGFYYAELPAGAIKPSNGTINNSYIRRLAVDPRNAQVVYAAGEQGFWKSTNGAHNWEQLADWIVHAVIIDTLHPDTLYYGGTDFYRSFDGGMSNQKIYNNQLGLVEDIVINPKNTNVLYCRTSNYGNTIFKSENYGETWDALRAFEDAGTLAIDPNHPDTVYCGKYRSTNGGVSWSNMDKNVVKVQLGNSNKLYALYRGEFAVSEDWGSNWQILDKYDFFPAGATYSNNFYLNKNMYFTVANGIRFSNDGGQTWEWFKGGFNSRALDIVALPDKAIYYVATHGYGVWAYNNYTSVNGHEIKGTSPVNSLMSNPNPFSNHITISGFHQTKGVLKIFNLLGQVVYSIDIHQNEPFIIWDGNNFSGKPCPTGSYLVIYLAEGEKIQQVKIVKQ